MPHVKETVVFYWELLCKSCTELRQVKNRDKWCMLLVPRSYKKTWMGTILWFVWKFVHQNEKSGISFRTEVLKPYRNGWLWCFPHGWSVLEMQLFVDSLVSAERCVHAGGVLQYSCTPLSAEEVFWRSGLWQQCHGACWKPCDKEGLMEGQGLNLQEQRMSLGGWEAGTGYQKHEEEVLTSTGAGFRKGSSF